MIDFGIRARKFYGLNNKSLPEVDAKSLASSLSHWFLNDNQVINLIFDFARTNNCLPNDFELASHSDLPATVQQVLTSLHRQFPAVEAFANDELAFEFIRDTRAQYGQELDGYLDFLQKQVDAIQQQPTGAAPAAAPVASSE